MVLSLAVAYFTCQLKTVKRYATNLLFSEVPPTLPKTILLRFNGNSRKKTSDVSWQILVLVNSVKSGYAERGYQRNRSRKDSKTASLLFASVWSLTYFMWSTRTIRKRWAKRVIKASEMQQQFVSVRRLRWHHVFKNVHDKIPSSILHDHFVPTFFRYSKTSKHLPWSYFCRYKYIALIEANNVEQRNIAKITEQEKFILQLREKGGYKISLWAVLISPWVFLQEAKSRHKNVQWWLSGHFSSHLTIQDKKGLLGFDGQS